MVKMLNQALGQRHEGVVKHEPRWVIIDNLLLKVCQYTQNLYGYLTGDSKKGYIDIFILDSLEHHIKVSLCWYKLHILRNYKKWY